MISAAVKNIRARECSLLIRNAINRPTTISADTTTSTQTAVRTVDPMIRLSLNAFVKLAKPIGSISSSPSLKVTREKAMRQLMMAGKTASTASKTIEGAMKKNRRCVSHQGVLAMACTSPPRRRRNTLSTAASAECWRHGRAGRTRPGGTHLRELRQARAWSRNQFRDHVETG